MQLCALTRPPAFPSPALSGRRAPLRALQRAAARARQSIDASSSSAVREEQTLAHYQTTPVSSGAGSPVYRRLFIFCCSGRADPCAPPDRPVDKNVGSPLHRRFFIFYHPGASYLRTTQSPHKPQNRLAIPLTSSSSLPSRSRLSSHRPILPQAATRLASPSTPSPSLPSRSRLSSHRPIHHKPQHGLHVQIPSSSPFRSPGICASPGLPSSRNVGFTPQVPSVSPFRSEGICASPERPSNLNLGFTPQVPFLSEASPQWRTARDHHRVLLSYTKSMCPRMVPRSTTDSLHVPYINCKLPLFINQVHRQWA
jgi:hypothetical protein